MKSENLKATNRHSLQKTHCKKYLRLLVFHPIVKKCTKFTIYGSKAFIWDQSQLCSSIRSWDISKTRWIFGWKMAKINMSQKIAYNVTIIDWNWKNHKWPKNLKLRAVIWNQSHLYSSISSWDISKTRWILGLKMEKNDHLDAKKLLITWQSLTEIGKSISGLKTSTSKWLRQPIDASSLFFILLFIFLLFFHVRKKTGDRRTNGRTHPLIEMRGRI